jgi:multidrug resistance efflux pump
LGDRGDGVNRRSALIAAIGVALAAAAGVGLYVRAASAAAPGVIAVAGDVRADVYVVRAPAITNPASDYTVGITTTGTPAPKKKPGGSAPAGASRAPVVSGFLSEVLVTEGAHVDTGAVLARLDTRLLDLGVASAEAAAAKARADLDVLDNNGIKLSDARAKLASGRKKLVAVRASLAATITALVAKRASLETSIAAIAAIIAQPGGPPPHVPPYPVLLAALKNALSGLNAGLAGARTGLATIDTNLAKMAKGLRTMDAAIQQLAGAHDLLEINIDSQDVAVRLAKARRDAATITSPVSGFVTFAKAAGTAVMVGAPVVRIRPDGPVRVDTYLTGDELASVTIGTQATVDFDSNTGSPLTGRIASIGDTAVVPPTSFPTAIVHMTRAVRVTIELDSGQTAPPGTPVDIEIRTGLAH